VPTAPPLLWHDGDRELRIDAVCGPTAGVVALLQRVEWGTSGPRYRMHHLQELVASMEDTEWLRLWHGEQLVGCYGLAPRQVKVGDTRVAAHHRTLLAVDGPRTNRGWGRELVTTARRHFLDEADGPHLLYGYIETDNARSLRLSEDVGYRSVGTFTCRLVSARRPRPHPRVRLARPDDGLAERLEGLWGDHALADDVVGSMEAQGSWVLEDRLGRPLAALQVRPERWTVTSLAGRSGRLLVGLLPALRALLPAVRGRDLQYLRVSHLWVAQGQNDALGALLSGVMAQTGHHAAIHFGDPRSRTTARLREAFRPGLLGWAGVEPEAHVMVGARGLDLTPWEGRRVWISPRDPA